MTLKNLKQNKIYDAPSQFRASKQLSKVVNMCYLSYLVTARVGTFDDTDALLVYFRLASLNVSLTLNLGDLSLLFWPWIMIIFQSGLHL